MNRSIQFLILLTVALITTWTMAAFLPGGGPHDLSWNTIDGGGGTATGGAFVVTATIGQHDASPVALVGGGFEVRGGFWHGGILPKPPCPSDIAPAGGNGMVNVDDLLAVINGWGPCSPPCPPHCIPDIAPPGGNCVVNVDDLLAIINAWGICP